CQGILSALPAEEIAQRFEQPVARARILLAGACIITAMMARLRLDEITVSPHGIREGALLAYARYGERWLERVSATSTRAGRRRASTLAHMPPVDTAADGMVGMNGTEPARNETFEQAGQRMLHERLQKFLEWPDEVLKNEDVEAVHKMRVASRRLRATLDAFESICDPKAFKRVYRNVKKAADGLGAARDTDVMIERLRSQLAHSSSDEQPGIDWLIERLQTFRQEKQRDLGQYLHELEKIDFKRQVEACLPVKKAEAQHG
ncbi:MAG TPA: CHAD domain-containing protein, partial [Ktedonobacteraceae bacterium]|nr:CHAD domain-containing protein [Ktedonobacteraceae bacterium]